MSANKKCSPSQSGADTVVENGGLLKSAPAETKQPSSKEEVGELKIQDLCVKPINSSTKRAITEILPEMQEDIRLRIREL